MVHADLLMLDMDQVIPAGVNGSTLKVYELDGGSMEILEFPCPATGPWTDVIVDDNPGNPGT